MPIMSSTGVASSSVGAVRQPNAICVCPMSPLHSR